MGSAPQTARGRAARDRIIESAAALVRQQGVAATSLEMVESAAGVGRSQMYHYFDDRDDLLRAMATSTANPVVDRAAAALAGVQSLADIDTWFESLVAANAQSGSIGGCPIGSLVAQMAERDEQTRNVFVDIFARWEQPLLACLQRLQRNGELRTDIDVADVAGAIMAAMQGGLLLAQVRRDSDQLRRALTGARAALAVSAA
jgi:TetR/AcrR family transcriptional regulator, transcriptional repressor for nem operon